MADYKINDVVSNDGSSYICIQDHTSGTTTEPGTGASWTTYWELAAQMGNQGNQGSAGSQGNQGDAGAQGDQGAQGDVGAQGNQGDNGVDGVQGNQGDNGIDGNQGYQGASVTGAQGNQGSQGSQGNQGYQGSQGNQGIQGNQGNVGSTFVLTTAPADHNASGITISLTAHANVAFGDVCYINADGEAQLIDANAIASMSAIVMAVATISANNAGLFLLQGIATDETWNWTVGGMIYGTVTGTSGNTLSQIAPTATDDVVQIMGVATHADRMFFNPQLVQVERT